MRQKNRPRFGLKRDLLLGAGTIHPQKGLLASDLVGMEDLQKGFVDVRLALEAVLDLVDVVDGVVELHRLIVLDRRSGGSSAEWLVELHGRGPRRGVRRDGRIALTAGCQCLRLERLWQTSKMIFSNKLQPDVEENMTCPLLSTVKQLKIYIHFTGLYLAVFLV